MIGRRKFIKGLAGTAVMATSARSYANILGANDRLNVAVMGTRSRGKSLLGDLVKSRSSNVTRICDVDHDILDSTVSYMASLDAPRAEGHSDVRHVLDDPSLDALVIATPDHWHATATIMALKAGKHVYLEKPCGYDPNEGELLSDAQKKYDRVVQMGNQQRSSPESIALMAAIRSGEIGEPYHATCWYANNRPTIGNGKIVAVPDRLDWDLWQGPAPRRKYADNLVPYNWHWFWHWGTGELCNNAAHELDIARWALSVDFPSKVSVDGTRRFFTDDDWEMYDTMFAKYEFEGNKSITWEGHSCNKVLKWGRDRGTMIYGSKGSVLVDRAGFTMFNLDGELIREMIGESKSGDSGDLVGGGPLTSLHVENFLDTVNGTSSTQHSPIDEGHKSTLLCHLGNIAYRTQSPLTCDSSNGHILANKAANCLWSREYEAGWDLEI
jgi:predicted dehydrogenase